MAAGASTVYAIVFLLQYVQFVCGCGVVTHTEIGYRAIEHFADDNQKFTYQKLILKHTDAYQAGNPYPDAYYPNQCAGGKYHDIAEDSHWSGFLNATLNYIQKKYPQPWNETAEKLVVFMLGFVSHQVADVLWHNLGISEGFLQTMADINFHGAFGLAHDAGDFGGDILNIVEMNFNYTDDLSDWYVPMEDLYNIYLEFYGTERMPMNVIKDCTSLLFLARLGEHFAVGELYAEYAKKSPFLLDQLSDYFVGGLDDMAAWTQLIWKHVIFMLEHGQSKCTVPHNPLYITCDNTTMTNQKTNRKSSRETGIPLKLIDHGLTYDDIVVEKAYPGIRFRASEKLKALFQERRAKHRDINRRRKEKQLKQNQLEADAIYSVPENYAKFGWSMAVGDLNNDGQDDLAIGAPGHGSEFSPQDGVVFIVYGTDNGLPLNITNFYTAADRVIIGPFRNQTRFGSSIAIVDVNLDGINDIAVGAPNYRSKTTPLKYNGMVYVYYGSKEDFYRYSQVNMTISCQDTFCNNGWSLSSGDLNGDGQPDLILGSPFAPAGGQQRGFMGAVYASNKYKAMSTLSVDTLDWIQKGQQDYAWFGEDMAVKKHPSGQNLLLVNQPMFRNCTLSNCNYTTNDTQSEGQLFMYSLPTGGVSATAKVTGTQRFQTYGASFDIGQPLKNGMTLLAVSAVGEDVEGKLADIDTKFSQAGVVHLLNITDIKSPSFKTVAKYAGDRRYDRFGAKVKFADLNRDGLDDLIITAPFRTEDATEEIFGSEEGRVYIFMGGDKFPLGDKALFNCGTLSVIQPCPGSMATYELILGEEKARFGSNIAVLKSKNAVNLMVTAIHSSRENRRLNGAVAIYKFPLS